MEKSKFAICIDSLVASLIIFLISFFILRRFIKNANFLLFCCILLSILAFISIFKYFLKQYNLKNISLKQQKHLLSCLNFFKFENPKNTNSFLENLLNATFKNNNIFENDSFIYYINLRTSLSEKEFFFALDYHFKAPQKTLAFITQKTDNEVKNLLSLNSQNFLFFDAVDIYELMKSKNLFPTKTTEEKPRFIKVKEYFSKFLNRLTKHHFKDYFLSGLSLITLSFFLPFSIYYSLFGTLLLILSIICLISSKSTKLVKNKISLFDTTKK